MPQGQDEMMDWLYQFVRAFGEQGIAIQALSEKLDESLREEFAANGYVKDEVWQAFIRMDGVKIEGSEEEVGVMRNLELGDALALGYGVRKVLVQADPVDVEMVDAVVESPRPNEKESGKGEMQRDDEVTQSGILANSSKPVTPNAITPILQSPEPKGQFIPTGDGSPFTQVGPSSEPRSGSKRSYKIADDPRGTQGSQRRLQSLLNAARAEADSLHPPDIAPPLQRDDGVSNVDINGHSILESADIPKVDSRSHIQQPTAATNSQSPIPGPPDQSTDTAVTTNGQRHEMDIKFSKVPPQIPLSTTGGSIPKVGYQYQSALNNTRVERAQLSNSSTEKDEDGIDYFTPGITRHGPVPRQRRRGRPKGPGHQLISSSQGLGDSSPKDLASMSFSSLAEVEQFHTPKPPPKKRGRPLGSTGKKKTPISELRPDMISEDTADTGLHINDSGLRSSRRQPKPRQFFTPTQAASPEAEPITVKLDKSAAHTTPSKPPRKYREPIYTSYEDLLRQEDDRKRKTGIDGVYINPLDAREGRSLARKKTLVVLVKSQKLRDPDWLENRKGTWIEVLAEKRKVLHAMAEAAAAKIAGAAAEGEKQKKRKRGEDLGEESSKRKKPSDNLLGKDLELSNADPAKKTEVPNAEIAKPSEDQTTGPEKPSEVLNTESTKRSEALRDISKPSEKQTTEPEKALENFWVGDANLQEVLNLEISKPPQIPNAESEKPLEVRDSDPAKSSDVPNTGSVIASEISTADPRKSPKIIGTNPDSFPSNEELALEFEKFKALSAANTLEDSSLKPDSFPSNEELALEFEKFKAGFAQQPSQNVTTESPRTSRTTIEPFVVDSIQCGKQAVWVHPRGPSSVPNTQIPGPSSSFPIVYMDPMHPRSPQAHLSHPVSPYEPPSHISRPQTTSFQNQSPSAAIQQSQQSRWSEPLVPHQASAAAPNSLSSVSNINSCSSSYVVQTENNQAAGRSYQPPHHGYVSVTHTPPPGDRCSSPCEGEQRVTPSIVALNPWLAKDPAHFHKPVHESPVHQRPTQPSWPAGFLPPEPLQHPKPQIQLKTEWPAGFLPPNALPSDTIPSSPMSTDSHRQFSPASVSHAPDPSTMIHASQATVSNCPTAYVSPQPMGLPHAPRPQSAIFIPHSPSPYPRPAISTTNQPQVLTARQLSLGQVQVSSPLSQRFNPMDSALRTTDAAPAESHTNTTKPEMEIQAQALLDRSSPAPSSLDQGPVSTKSLKASEPGKTSDQTQLSKAIESQPDKTLSKVSITAQVSKSPPVQPDPNPTPKPALEPNPEPNPETRKRKRSMPNIQQAQVPQLSVATTSNLPEPTNAIIEKVQPSPSTVTSDDVEAFKKAEAIQFEPFFARMSSIYNSVMGNLILSFDKTVLNFWSMAEGETDPIWTMQVWKMAENPIVSMPGSNPMELRLKEKKDDESVVVHRFLIARTKEANKSANEMRANLVTARIFVQMANPQIVQAEDPEVIATKPWKCEKCGSRFKNKEGIKYHLSKSQTTCNPDFNPKNLKSRQYGGSKKEAAKKGKVAKMNSKPIPAPEEEVQPEPADESEGGDSDDSVFEWAAKVVALKKSPNTNKGDPVIGRSGKVYRAWGGERPALLEIAEIVKKTPSLKEELAKIPSLPQTPDQSLPETLSSMSKEKVVKDIILCLLRANNNALPAERGLWFAFVACWLKYYPTSKVLPEHKLFSRALDELLEDGILSKITFDFPGARSRTIIRSILSDPKVLAPSSADIAKLKDEIKSKHPDFYIPPGFSPPNVILEILIAIGKPAPLAPDVSTAPLNDILGSDEEVGKGDSSDGEFKPEIHALDAEDDLEDDSMDLDVDSDGAGSEFSPFPDHTLPQVSAFTPLHQPKPLKINGSQIMRPRMRYPGQPLTLEERERRKRATALQEQMWSPKQTILQNSTNGAWDVSSKPKRTYKLRERLPEPITFMQGSSGSWSVRPFGHGVNPIFARPNKMTVGNPQGEHYLQQRDESHRPVLHPNKSVMRPAIPSKLFLNKNLPGDLVTRPDGQIEISKATGLPKRHYTYRTRSQKDPDISRYTGDKKRGYRTLTPDPMDLMEASVNGMNELDILNHYEAKPLEEEVGRKCNPGLASMPSTPATPGLSHIFLNESAGLWDLAHPFVACTDVEKLKMQWLDRTAFTLETIPYSALEDNDDLPPEQQTLIGPKRRRKQKKGPHIGVRKGLKNKWVMPRRLTSAPDDLLGVHRDVRYAANLLGTQMVNYDTNIRRKRQRFKEQGLATDEEERLTMGIVIIRALLGGLEMNIDWVILGSVFKDYSLNFLKKWWQVVWAKKKPMVEKLTKDFQAIFIVGYRKGQVQSIDYDHIIDYDFNTLIDWSMTKINTPTVEKKVFDLPNSFSELKNKYALVPEPRSNYWSEQYYYPLAAVYQRMNLVNSVPFTYPLQQDAPTYEIDDYALAKSWCRAAAVTPDHLWDSKAANKVLNRLPSAIIIKAREDLLKNKIITKNKRLRTNGRVYNLPDAFNAVFVRTGKVISEKQYREAYDFKCELDERFRNGEKIMNIPWGVNEGSVLAITNLQANGCIYVQKSNIRANKFGLTEGGYETRLIDKAKYRFQMDITPTPSYVYNHSIPNLDVISEPPPLGPRGAIPVWRSITGEVIEGMWRRVLLGVTSAFVLRSSIDIDGLGRVFSPSLDAWEIKQLIDWGVERGVWQKCEYEGLGATAKEASEMEGWEVGDWWWMIVGRYLADNDD
ncbi:hypothetical protein DSL72_009005 [Monilinia vaccinii-corymbosi]|uniref:Transcription factor tau subunit sfc3/Tfc3 C-terminal domain-containing protein n=1 Tax=Monilinia vaccinii-corymbosi TaxID=61207 RepID=A0A8A3PPU6_9HELO|nr:hypothetical protein DSL72_009005 [Monilinia vaccinii-corymbosi]